MRSLLIAGAVVGALALPPSALTQGTEFVALELDPTGQLPSTGRRDGRASYLDQPSQLFRVGHMEPGQRYPLLIVLPWTGGTSEQMWSRLEGLVPLGAYHVMLTPGAPDRDYLPRFYDYVSWLDERVGADLEQAARQHTIDPERAYLAGFSVGGDAGWALLLRHPERYRGALVLGARSSARPRRGARQALRVREQLRIAFAIGDSDDAARIRGITRANGTARGFGVETRFETFPGRHGTPPAPLMRSLRVRVRALSSVPSTNGFVEERPKGRTRIGPLGQP